MMDLTSRRAGASRSFFHDGLSGLRAVTQHAAALGLGLAIGFGLSGAVAQEGESRTDTRGITAPALVDIRPVRGAAGTGVADKLLGDTEDLSAIAVLGERDTLRYKRIFHFQDSGNWKAADALIAQLDDRVLMGHVLFQRYMHPTAYRSTYAELRDWLQAYADHPEATRIQALAQRRKPAGAPAPRRAEARLFRYAERQRTAFEVHNPRRSSAQALRARRIERHVRSLLRRERPTQALGYLARADIRRQLTRIEYDRIRQRVAQSYYAEQVDDKALEVAQAVAARSRAGVPLADWTAGLAAWRLDKHGLAATHFAALARAEHVSDTTRAAGAYWAARAFLRTRQTEKVIPMLKVAAESPLSFYGLLARRQLGLPVAPDWSAPALTAATRDTFLAQPAARRAIAAHQAGRDDLAAAELSYAHGRLDRSQDRALMALAGTLELPAVELRVAMAARGAGLAESLFPTPDFTPRRGYTVDRALLLAIIRKESKFLASAVSRAGARGLMQVMPITAHDVTGDRRFRGTRRNELLDPTTNLELGQAYVLRLMDQMNPDASLLPFLTAYNAGPGNLRRWLRTIEFDADPLLFVESLPVPETRAYVETVMANLWVYRTRLGQPTPSLDALASGAWPVYTPLEADPDTGRRERVAELLSE